MEDDKDVAEITDLMSRAGRWPDGLRWIARDDITVEVALRGITTPARRHRIVPPSR